MAAGKAGAGRALAAPGDGSPARGGPPGAPQSSPLGRAVQSPGLAPRSQAVPKPCSWLLHGTAEPGTPIHPRAAPLGAPWPQHKARGTACCPPDSISAQRFWNWLPPAVGIPSGPAASCHNLCARTPASGAPNPSELAAAASPRTQTWPRSLARGSGDCSFPCPMPGGAGGCPVSSVLAALCAHTADTEPIVPKEPPFQSPGAASWPRWEQAPHSAWSHYSSFFLMEED